MIDLIEAIEKAKKIIEKQGTRPPWIPEQVEKARAEAMRRLIENMENKEAREKGAKNTSTFQKLVNKFIKI